MTRRPDSDTPDRRLPSRSSGWHILMLMLVTCLVMSLLLCGCGADISKAEKLSAEQSVALLERADEIVMKKAPLSFGDRWDVYANDDLVATIKGEFLYMTDTYTMRSTNDDIICSEEEMQSFVTAKARKFDADGNADGWFDQEFTFWLAKIRILDRQGNETGSIEQKLSFTLDADIKDADGRTAWHLSRDMLSMSRSSLHLVRQDNEATVDVRDAVMVSAVMNEITESGDSDD